MRGKKAGWVVAAVVVLALFGQYGGQESAEQPEGAGSEVAATPAPDVEPVAEPSTSPSEEPQTRATSPAQSPTPKPTGKPARGPALAALAALPVKGRAPMTGYDRDRFGSAWLDADRNGCDTRNDVLDRDLTDKTVKAGTGACVVLSGVLADPYTGTDIRFVRGAGDEVDIDHVVALGNAWATGAFRWDIKKRAALANDPLDLLAVDYRSNRQKGDGDAATWLPSNRPVRCAYVARQISVKRKYGLWVTAPEKAAMQRVLQGCPDQQLTRDRWGAPTRVDHDITDPGAPGTPPAPEQGPDPAAPQPLVGGQHVHYENCTAVRAAGAAPIRRGDPGYGSHLDRDGDGVGCE